MLECLPFGAPPIPPTPTSLPSPPPCNSSDPTSPDFSIEYERAVQAHSFTELRSKIQAQTQAQLHQLDPDDLELELDEDSHHHNVLADALKPDRDSVREALSLTRHNHALTHLASSYFDHSESTGTLCLRLHRSVCDAREIYKPIHDLLSVLPPDNEGSFSQHLCNRAFDLFVDFDRRENPFLLGDSFNFAAVVRSSFSELKGEIERRRRRCNARIRLFKRCHTGCMICLVVTAVGAVASAALITAHAVGALAVVVLAPFSSDSCLAKRKESKELSRLKPLDAASKGTLGMIENIYGLVDRLQEEVESHKNMVRFALARGRERHPIQEVLKQLRKNWQGFEKLLTELDQQIFLCFGAVNRARSLLLQELAHYQDL